MNTAIHIEKLLPNRIIDLQRQAKQLARKLNSRFLNLEHLFMVLIEEFEINEFLVSIEVNKSALLNAVKPLLTEMPKATGQSAEPIKTARFMQTWIRACREVKASDSGVVNVFDLMAALLWERSTALVKTLERFGLTQTKLNSYRIDCELNQRTTLMSFAKNLTEKAKSRQIDPLIGREAELERLACILTRRKKNNPILIGEPGVGKTAIVEGLALMAAKGDLAGFGGDFELFSLNMGDLLSGTIFPGMVDGRLQELLKALQAHPNAVLFIDEIHMIANGGISGGSPDIANKLKPVLSGGEIRVIGATTPQEYKQSIQADKALSRRFQPILVDELSRKQTIELLKGLVPKYERFHQVSYPPACLEQVVDLADRFLTQRQFPDKAIDIIDEAGALLQRVRIKTGGNSRVVSPAVINRVISTMANIPQHKLSTSELKAYRDLEQNLKQQVLGQDTAVDKVCETLILSRSDLVGRESPMGCFLCVGPPGVGKTSLARSIANELQIHFERFDMSEYMEEHTVSRLIGAPPGYIAHERGGLLTAAIQQHPHTVLLIDEIEKAHPKVINILLQIMDYGMLTDAGGTKVNFRNVILMMTSNVGSAEKRAIGINNHQTTVSKLDDALRRSFSAEFLNRLSDIIQFQPLKADIVAAIIDQSLNDIKTRLKKRRIDLEIEDAAKQWLIANGHSTESGARPIKKLVKTQILNRLSRKLLLEGFQEGKVMIRLDPAGTTLTTQFSTPSQPTPCVTATTQKGLRLPR